MAVAAGTWGFSKAGVEASIGILSEGGSVLDAAEAGVLAVESDGSISSVGYGGLPDVRGVLSLDAALMTDCGRLGCVMSLEGRRAAIPVARLVMERCDHTQLVGAGVGAFASLHGIPELPDDELLTPEARRKLSEDGVAAPQEARKHTDTVGILARDFAGALAAGAATSGAAFKAHGRVGDTPVVGSGLYAEAGRGCVATGDGDKILRFCPAVRVVDLMAAGASASDACFTIVSRISAADETCQAALLAMDSDGSVGAATTHRGFPVVVWRSGSSEHQVIEGRAVSDTIWGS